MLIPLQHADDNIQPFANAALELHRYGLAPFPCGGDDGKRPLVKGFTSRRFSQNTLREFIGKFGDCNVGIATGKLSNITVVDVDDPEIVEQMLHKFGDTLLIIHTPSGGAHLFYRWNGESCRNLRNESLDVDIKGQGGFVVVPPSVRPTTGTPYVFDRGSFADVSILAKINPNSLNSGSSSAEVVSVRGIPVGNRNNTIFHKMLREVRHCDALADLSDVAHTINDNHTEEPLPAKELHRIVDHVWFMEQTGQNWVGQGARIFFTEDEIDVLAPFPSAMAFLAAVIRRFHWDPNKGDFVLSDAAMARDHVIDGWGRKRYRAAIGTLLELGFLEQTHQGRAKGDPHQYRVLSRT